MPTGGTNSFAIHMQEGFYQGREVVITIDGAPVYRGKPTTRAVLGLAEIISITATSIHPVVTFAIPSKRISWSKQIDLNVGVTLGISVSKDGKLEVRQAAGFGYD